MAPGGMAPGEFYDGDGENSVSKFCFQHTWRHGGGFHDGDSKNLVPSTPGGGMAPGGMAPGGFYDGDGDGENSVLSTPGGSDIAGRWRRGLYSIIPEYLDQYSDL